MQKKCRKLSIITTGSLYFLCLLLSGCWDQREIQNRNFVLAIGIDIADRPDANSPLSFAQPHGDKRYSLSLQVVNLAPQKDTKQNASKTYVISNTGQSFFEMVRDMLGQSGRVLWFEHIQAIVISEAVLKDANIDTILDFFLRDAEFRSRMRLFVTPGKAKSILEYQPRSGDLGGIYLAGISQNHKNNMHIVLQSDLGFFQETLANHADAVIPRVELNDKDLKMGGSAAIRQGQFIGYLDEYTTMGLRLIRGSEKNAVITVASPDNPENLLILQAYRHDTTLTPHVDGENIYFTLDIHMAGDVDELQNAGARDEFDTTKPEDVRKLELLFAQEIKHSALHAWQQLQTIKLANLHYLHLDAKLRSKYPAIWRKVKDDWYEHFSDIPLVVSANVTIRNSGKHK